MCIHRRGPTYSGSQPSSNPIRAGRWQPATGLFNSPNDIRASWSALMITHSTNLHLHQHTRHRDPAQAKRVRLQSALVRICMPRLTDLSMNPRTRSAAWPEGVCHFSLACRNASSGIPFNDAKQRWLFLYDKFSKEAGAVSTFFWKGALISLIKLGDMEAVAVNEMDRGLGRCRLFKIQSGSPVGSLPCPHLWIALTLREEKNATKPNHNWLYSGGNVQSAVLPSQIEPFKCHKVYYL